MHELRHFTKLLVALGIAGAAWAAPSLDEVVAKFFTPADVARGSALGQRRAVCFALEQALTLAVLAAAAFTGPGRRAAEAVRGRFGRPLIALAAEGAALGVAVTLATLPVHYYRGHVMEHELGLSTQGLAGWLRDFALEHAIGLVLLVGGLLIVELAQRRWPRGWWVAGWIALTAGIIAFFAVHPLVVAPLFNDFQPLPAGPLKDGVQKIARDAGIPVSEVFVVDASRRTRRYNAFFFGVGATRTIALYDTLVKGVSTREALSVVGHEAGHWTCHHLARGIGIASALLLGGLWLLARPRVCGAWPFARPGAPARALAVALALQLAFLPVENGLGRAMEAEADAEALRLTGDPDAMATMFVALARSNVSNLTPHPLVRSWLFTHPPIPERIRAALAWKER
jgi:STE24 endopeptidase